MNFWMGPSVKFVRASPSRLPADLQIWQILHPVIDLSTPLSDAGTQNATRQNCHWNQHTMLGGLGFSGLRP